MAQTAGSTALILAGAVAKGAFEAGALSVLAENGIPVDSVMGTSAGALTGALYAAGIRTRREKDAARELLELWRDHATWWESFRPSPLNMLELRGLATPGHVATLLKDTLLKLLTGGDRRPVNLSLVVCPLTGTTEPGSQATTFEKVIRFKDDDFENPAMQDRIRDSALASAAFPVAYAPVKLEFDDIGSCIDGGTVNNTPVRHAMETEAGDISRVIVVCPEPEQYRTAEPYGFDYLVHVLTILIQERLYRDLREADEVNQKLAALTGLVGKAGFTSEHLKMVMDVLGWRTLEIVPVRPGTPLPGTPFSAFSDKSLRQQYIDAGISAAQAALGTLRKAAPPP